MRARPLLTRGSEGMLETRSAIASAHARLVGRWGRLAALNRPRRHWRRLRQRAREAVIDDDHIAELRQLDIGLDRAAAGIERGDHADREARREDAALARGQDALADLWRAAPADIKQPRPGRIVAGEDGVGARALDDDRDARIEVGDEEDPRGAAADLGQAAAQPLAGDHRLTSRQRLLAAGIDHDG